MSPSASDWVAAVIGFVIIGCVLLFLCLVSLSYCSKRVRNTLARITKTE